MNVEKLNKQHQPHNSRSKNNVNCKDIESILGYQRDSIGIVGDEGEFAPLKDILTELSFTETIRNFYQMVKNNKNWIVPKHLPKNNQKLVAKCPQLAGPLDPGYRWKKKHNETCNTVIKTINELKKEQNSCVTQKERDDYVREAIEGGVRFYELDGIRRIDMEPIVCRNILNPLAEAVLRLYISYSNEITSEHIDRVMEICSNSLQNFSYRDEHGTLKTERKHAKRDIKGLTEALYLNRDIPPASSSCTGANAWIINIVTKVSKWFSSLPRVVPKFIFERKSDKELTPILREGEGLMLEAQATRGKLKFFHNMAVLPSGELGLRIAGSRKTPTNIVTYPLITN